jgi:hypothetical protein
MTGTTANKAITMRSHTTMRRFGQKLKLPSIVSIKHQILVMMLEDEISATPADVTFDKEKSPAIAALRRLRSSEV